MPLFPFAKKFKRYITRFKQDKKLKNDVLDDIHRQKILPDRHSPAYAIGSPTHISPGSQAGLLL